MAGIKLCPRPSVNPDPNKDAEKEWARVDTRRQAGILGRRRLRLEFGSGSR
jgi:hypothetical protein